MNSSYQLRDLNKKNWEKKSAKIKVNNKWTRIHTQKVQNSYPSNPKRTLCLCHLTKQRACESSKYTTHDHESNWFVDVGNAISKFCLGHFELFVIYYKCTISLFVILIYIKNCNKLKKNKRAMEESNKERLLIYWYDINVINCFAIAIASKQKEVKWLKCRASKK